MTNEMKTPRMTSADAYKAVDVLIDRMGVTLNTYERQKLQQAIYEFFTWDLTNGYTKLAKAVQS